MSFRPSLRPGAPLLRRDATHLQIGTSPGVVLADRPGLMGLLRLLDGVRDVDRIALLADRDVPELRADVPRLLDELRAVGAVVDAASIETHRRRLSGRPVGFVVSAGAAGLVAATRGALVSAGLDDVTSTAAACRVRPARAVGRGRCGRRPSCGTIAAHAGSASVRCRSWHVTHGVRPGRTRGPTRTRSSSMTTGRWSVIRSDAWS